MNTHLLHQTSVCIGNVNEMFYHKQTNHGSNFESFYVGMDNSFLGQKKMPQYMVKKNINWGTATEELVTPPVDNNE